MAMYDLTFSCWCTGPGKEDFFHPRFAVCSPENPRLEELKGSGRQLVPAWRNRYLSWGNNRLHWMKRRS